MLTCDWSSDVCSSDLGRETRRALGIRAQRARAQIGQVALVARQARAQCLRVAQPEIGRASCRERVQFTGVEVIVNSKIDVGGRNDFAIGASMLTVADQ